MLDVEASARKCNQPSDLYLQLFATALQRFPSFSVTDVSRSSSPRHTRSSLCRAASHRAMKPPRLTKQQLQTKGNRAGCLGPSIFKNISMTARSLNILHRAGLLSGSQNSVITGHSFSPSGRQRRHGTRRKFRPIPPVGIPSRMLTAPQSK